MSLLTRIYDKIKETAGAIANGALKFEMVKVNANQIITYDIDRALRFEGFTAAYLQYTYARIRSIIRKSGSRKSGVYGLKPELLTDENEHKLAMKLARYAEAVAKAGEEYDPSEVAKYLFELAQLFNDYYHAVSVLKAEEDIKNARLALAHAVSLIIKNGLGLLGIGVVEEM